MKVLVIFTHPREESFNRAVLNETLGILKAKGHDVRVRDLYLEKFSPVLNLEDFKAIQSGETPSDIATEQEHIKWADRLVFINPIWWMGMPAILKGYIDRVFSYGFAYEYKDGIPEGLLHDKEALMINTTGTPFDVYDENGGHAAMRFVTDLGIMEFCGIKTIDHIFFGSVPSVDDETRKGYLMELAEKLRELF